MKATQPYISTPPHHRSAPKLLYRQRYMTNKAAYDSDYADESVHRSTKALPREKDIIKPLVDGNEQLAIATMIR